MFVRQLFTKYGLGVRIHNFSKVWLVRKPKVRKSKTSWNLLEGISACNVPNHRNLSKVLQRSDCTYDTFSSLLPTIKLFENTPSWFKQPPPSTLYKTISLHHCALCRWSRYAVRRCYKLLYMCVRCSGNITGCNKGEIWVLVVKLALPSFQIIYKP